jgi:FNIP Repeat
MTYLGIGSSHYSYCIDHLPNSLTKLTLRGDFGVHEQSFDHLPSSLQSLGLYSSFRRPPIDHLPPALSDFSLNGIRIDHLPPTVTTISIGFSFNQPLEYLPSSVEHLTINCNLPLDHLPASLKYTASINLLTILLLPSQVCQLLINGVTSTSQLTIFLLPLKVLKYVASSYSH